MRASQMRACRSRWRSFRHAGHGDGQESKARVTSTPKSIFMDASRSVAMQTIGFIGVGNIGIAISKHLIDAGHKVVGYRRAQAIILSNMNSHCGPSQAVSVGKTSPEHETHDAIHAWAAAHQRLFGGRSWEIYGDWSDDPSKLETTVEYLLS